MNNHMQGGDTKWNTSTSGNGFSSAKWLYSHTKFITGTYGYWITSPYASDASNTLVLFSIKSIIIC